MLWIIPLILFIIFSILYIYNVYTRRINKKLIKKQRYYLKTPRLLNNFSTSCKITFMATLASLIITFSFFIIPHTNGTIKDLKNQEDLEYLYDNYYSEEAKTTEHDQVKKLANQIKNTSSMEEAITFEDNNLVYIENGFLVLNKLNSELITYPLENSSNKNATLFQDVVIVYEKDKLDTVITVHSTMDLEVIKKIHIHGKIELLSIDGSKLTLAINHKLSDDALLKIDNEEYILDYEDIHYDLDNKFFQTLTIITFDSKFKPEFFSLCLGEYYIFDNESSIFVVANNKKIAGKLVTNVYLYDKLLGFVSRRIELAGYTYLAPTINNSSVKIKTVEKKEELKLFHEYVLDLGLWIKKGETIETLSNENKVPINLKDDSILGFITENSLVISKEVDLKEEKLVIDLEKYDVRIFEEEIYMISNEENKSISKVKVSLEGLTIVEVLNYDKLNDHDLLYSYEDNHINFVFKSNFEVILVTIKENSVEITNIFESKNLINVYMLDEEIFILNQSDVLVYNLKEKKFIEIDKNDSLLNEESQNPII